LGRDAALHSVGRAVADDGPTIKGTTAMTRAAHPDDETLRRFALGRLSRSVMVGVEGHLRGCRRCAEQAMRAPDDRLVGLLRLPAIRPDGDGRDRLAIRSS
jgi:hypothetical protein